MRVAINTYPNTNQNIGGIQMRVKRTFAELRSVGTDVVLFDQWNHEIRQFDILHSFKLHHAAYELNLTSKSRGVKSVISTVLPPEFPVRRARIMGKLWDRGVCQSLIAYTLYDQARKADALIAVSNAEASLISSAFGVCREKIHIVPNCADANVYASADAELFRSQYGLSKYVLAVGRVEPNKNQLRLIHAMRNIDMKLVIIGRVSDDSKDYAKKCAAVGGDQVLFIDHLPYHSPILASAYAGAEAFVLASVSEIAPNSTLEAAMAGTRVVVTRNALAPAEWFGEDATYIDPLDESDIEAGIAAALRAPRSERMRRRILADYSWEAGAQKTLNVYKSVLAK